MALKKSVLFECEPGRSSCQRVCGVFMSRVEDEERFRRKDTVMTISTHKWLGRPVSIMISLVSSSSEQLKHSDTGFCLGVSGGAHSNDLPLLNRYCLNSFDVYTPPQSDLSILICFPWSLSTSSRNLTKFEKTLDFNLITHI